MTENIPPAAPQTVTFLTWLKLMRLPTVFTALSNILCGYYVSSPKRDLAVLAAQPALWLLLLASAGLYLGGMVLNDVFDADLDARERPERPIPSGRISRRSAAILGAMLMLTGLGSAWNAGRVTESGSTSFLVAVILAAMIVLYDSFLKNTVVAPLGMGGCRFLNLILGASCCPDWQTVFSVTNPTLWIATALAVYVIGVTWFARNEAGDSSAWALIAGLAMALGGIAIDATVCWRLTPDNRAAVGALVALALVAGNVGLRCANAIRVNHPLLLQKTVGFMQLNIIFIDTAMMFCMTGSGRLATTIVILVIPAMLMKRAIPLS